MTAPARRTLPPPNQALAPAPSVPGAIERLYVTADLMQLKAERG
jgi:hypothetical protein